MHPYTQMTMATQHQADLIAEADHARLVRSARKSSPQEPTTGRRLVAAAAAAVLAISLAGAVFAAQNGAGSNVGGHVNHGGEPCVVVGTGPKLAC